MTHFSVTAGVQLTLEIDAGSSWGEDCTIEQVRRQASKETLIRINNILNAAKVRAKVIGDPKIICVVHSDTQ